MEQEYRILAIVGVVVLLVVVGNISAFIMGFRRKYDSIVFIKKADKISGWVAVITTDWNIPIFIKIYRVNNSFVLKAPIILGGGHVILSQKWISDIKSTDFGYFGRPQCLFNYKKRSYCLVGKMSKFIFDELNEDEITNSI